MSEHEKKLVSFSRFVELLNEELMSLPTYEEGMLFVDVGSGYDFRAPMLSITALPALDKHVFDLVSKDYTISQT